MAKSKTKKMREHEIELKILDWVAKDPEAKYFLGAMTGAGIASFGMLLSQANPTAKKPTKSREEILAAADIPTNEDFTDPTNPNNAAIIEEFKKKALAAAGYVESEPDKKPYDWVGAGQWLAGQVLPFGPSTVIGWGAGSSKDATPSGDLFNNVSNLFVLGGESFAGFCTAMLIFKAIFGTGGMSEMLKGIGEIVPL